MLLLGIVFKVGATDSQIPHPHQGVLAPYEIKALSFPLNEKQEKKLARGALVLSINMNAETAGRGIAVLDINAPVNIVWSRIRGFEHYVEWVGPIKEAEVYRRDRNHTFAYIRISGLLYNYEYNLRNSWWPEHNLMTWEQDNDRYSDFDDSVGAWYVEPHPSKEGWSRAWFSNDLKLRGKIPEFLMNFIKRQGLKDATAWVKKESEIAARTLDARDMKE